MKEQIKRLRALIQTLYPYRTYKNLRRIFAGLALISFIAMIAFCLFEPEPVPYEKAKQSQHAYLDIDYISEEDYDGYYIVEANGYSYIYYQIADFSRELIDLQEGKSKQARIYGSSDTNASDEVLKGLIPMFNNIYDEQVNSIKELVEYTGSNYFDNDAVPNYVQIGFTLIMSVLFLFFYLITILIERYWQKRFTPSLEMLCYKGEDRAILDELQHPIRTFYNLKVALLPNYFVCNHPSPYIIAYEDMVMIYENHLLSKEIHLFVYDRDLKRHKVMVASSMLPANHNEIKELFAFLSNFQPKILVGNTKENEQILSQMKDYQ